MLRLSFLEKVLYILNIFFSFVLLFSYALPYFFIKGFPYFTILSLAEPVFISINIVFLVYWLANKLKKQFLVSFIVLLLGIPVIQKFFNLGVSNIETSGDFKIMTYNVRLFNQYGWISSDNIDKKIAHFVEQENPDIICFQEFYKDQSKLFKAYPYRHLYFKTEDTKVGQAIFSKFPILKKGNLDFQNTINNTIFADIKVKKDTFRLYNVHMQSFKMKYSSNSSISKKTIGNMASRFLEQKQQSEIIKAAYSRTRYKRLVCGDFNNTAFSYVYRKVRDDLKDSFEEAGSGLGLTYQLGIIPLRIDFILIDSSCEVISHKNHLEKYSDHYPVSAKVSL